MKALLEVAGASMADLLQVQVALVDSDRNWEPMNEVYTTKVPEPRPVRSYFGCTGFGTPGQLVQIDAIAYAE
jgi:enamine deaminase RidA (YjgF/YER057c/UK114 family)